MYYDYLERKKREITIMRQEIEVLKEKKKQLKKLESDYYKKYYDPKYRDEKLDYILLDDFPHNTTGKKHILYDYSVLNVDTIGKIICQLLKYDGNDVVSERLYETEISDNIFHDKFHYPVLVIGNSEEIDELNSNDNNIIIRFEYDATLDKYPTKKPIIWNLPSSHKRSNYSHLVGYIDGLAFDCSDKQKYNTIRQLIYCLAYYQKQHNIRQMTPNDTWNVYRKIYYKK